MSYLSSKNKFKGNGLTTRVLDVVERWYRYRTVKKWTIGGVPLRTSKGTRVQIIRYSIIVQARGIKCEVECAEKPEEASALPLAFKAVPVEAHQENAIWRTEGVVPSAIVSN